MVSTINKHHYYSFLLSNQFIPHITIALFQDGIHFSSHNDKVKKVFTAISVKLKGELKCILFPLIISQMFLQLEWSPPVVNSADRTQCVTPVYVRSHSS